MALTGIQRNGADQPAEAWPWAGDIPYPSDDGERMAETDLQYYAITDAVFALKGHLETLGRSGTVRGDCALYYDPDILTAYVAPDVLLAFDVMAPRDAGFVPWVQGKVPDLVVEVASLSTHTQDSGSKHARYAALGIAEYWQYDPHHRYLAADLIGWRLQTGRYDRIPLSYDPTRGAWLGESAVLGTVWGLEEATGALRLWNPAAQAWYLTDREVEAARRREAARADREAARRREATRAAQEAARADREAARAAQAEAEIARLRALLRDAGHEAADFLP